MGNNPKMAAQAQQSGSSAPQQNAQQQHSQSTQQEADPISQFKDLIPRLKASLVNVMRVSGKVFKENSQADNLSLTSEGNVERLDQHLEHFYSICDQIEMNLKLALECAQQNVESSKYTPVPVNSPVCKQETPPATQPTEPQNYPQYISTVQAQIKYAKEIHDAFLECSKKISERRPLPIQFQQQAQAQAPSTTQLQQAQHSTPTQPPLQTPNVPQHQPFVQYPGSAPST